MRRPDRISRLRHAWAARHVHLVSCWPWAIVALISLCTSTSGRSRRIAMTERCEYPFYRNIREPEQVGSRTTSNLDFPFLSTSRAGFPFCHIRYATPYMERSHPLPPGTTFRAVALDVVKQPVGNPFCNGQIGSGKMERQRGSARHDAALFFSTLSVLSCSFV